MRNQIPHLLWTNSIEWFIDFHLFSWGIKSRTHSQDDDDVDVDDDDGDDDGDVDVDDDDGDDDGDDDDGDDDDDDIVDRGHVVFSHFPVRSNVAFAANMFYPWQRQQGPGQRRFSAGFVHFVPRVNCKDLTTTHWQWWLIGRTAPGSIQTWYVHIYFYDLHNV